MSLVLTKCDPLKIFNAVIKLVPIDVVDGEVFPISRNKSNSDKTMDKIIDAVKKMDEEITGVTPLL